MRSWLLGALVGLVMLGMLVIGIVTFGLAALALAIVFGITSVVRLFLGRTGKRGRTISPVVPNTGERVLVIGHQPR
jgi:hypothetical protein